MAQRFTAEQVLNEIKY